MKNKKTVLKRRIIKQPKQPPVEFIRPIKKTKGPTFVTSKDYKYFDGHIVKDIVKQLPNKRVVCWYEEDIKPLGWCAYLKFINKKRYCKRCTLFQDDEHAQELKVLINEWEKDDLENLEK